MTETDNTTPTEDDVLWSIGRVAAVFDVGDRTIRRWWMRGEFPAPIRMPHPCRVLRWRRDDVLEWVKNLTTQEVQDEHSDKQPVGV